MDLVSLQLVLFAITITCHCPVSLTHVTVLCHCHMSLYCALQYLQAYVMKMTSDQSASQYAQYCLNNLRLRISPRRLPPSTTEIAVSEDAVFVLVECSRKNGLIFELSVIEHTVVF